MSEEDLKARVAELEKTLKNIVAVGDRHGASAASRLVTILDIAEKALHSDDWSSRVGGIPAR